MEGPFWSPELRQNTRALEVTSQTKLNGFQWAPVQASYKAYVENIEQNPRNIENPDLNQQALAAVQDLKIKGDTSKAYLSTKEIAEHYKQKIEHAAATYLDWIQLKYNEIKISERYSAVSC